MKAQGVLPGALAALGVTLCSLAQEPASLDPAAARATAPPRGQGIQEVSKLPEDAEPISSRDASVPTRLDAETIAYVSGTGGEPWGYLGNVNALNDVFGAGNWDRLEFPTAAGAGVWGYDLVFLDGGDGATLEFIDFVNANRTDMEAFVD
ncbi:MAG: hypothetical protein JSV91_14960, partial [Phycisphaerales bacterium]